MLTAMKENQEIALAWEAQRIEAPFFCPGCGQLLTLKKGEKKIHHFAHKPPTDCLYASGETEDHLRVKRAIYEALVNHPMVTKCALERNLSDVRPDVSMYVADVPVAIEVQRSNLSVETIIARFREYTRRNISLFWVLTQEPVRSELMYVSGNVHRLKKWHKYLRDIYRNRLYVHQWGAVVSVLEADPCILSVDASDWSKGYDYPAKSHVHLWDLGTINIVEHFHSRYRKPFEGFPGGLVWTPKGSINVLPTK